MFQFGTTSKGKKIDTWSLLTWTVEWELSTSMDWRLGLVQNPPEDYPLGQTVGE